MPIRLRAAAVSDVGVHRETNQDAAFTAPWGAAVADGVGGGPSGDLASAALVHRLVAEGAMIPDPETLVVRIREANWDIRAHVERDPALRGMATTFTGLFLGAAGDLLLAVWRRVPLEVLTVDGDGFQAAAMIDLVRLD